MAPTAGGAGGSLFSTLDPLTGAVSSIASITNPNGGIYAFAFVRPATETGCNNCLQPPDGMTMWLPFDESAVTSPSINVFGAAGVRSGGATGPGWWPPAGV